MYNLLIGTVISILVIVLIYVSPILYSWLIALSWTPTMILNQISESEYLGLILCRVID